MCYLLHRRASHHHSAPGTSPIDPLLAHSISGIDLPAPVGEAVPAIAAGTVIRAQRRGVGGLELLVQHDGFIGVYSHLGRVTPAIAEGNRSVRAGQSIGTVGRSGVTYGAHLYFGILRDGKPVDPAPLLALKPCDGNGQARNASTAAAAALVPPGSHTTAISSGSTLPGTAVEKVGAGPTGRGQPATDTPLTGITITEHANAGSDGRDNPATAFPVPTRTTGGRISGPVAPRPPTAAAILRAPTRWPRSPQPIEVPRP